MRVSCAQFFAMSPAERERVMHIDMDLDRAQDRYLSYQLTPRRRIMLHALPDPEAEPGTDWIGKDQDQ